MSAINASAEDLAGISGGVRLQKIRRITKEIDTEKHIQRRPLKRNSKISKEGRQQISSVFGKPNYQRAILDQVRQNHRYLLEGLFFIFEFRVLYLRRWTRVWAFL